MREAEIDRFWNANPCGDQFVDDDLARDRESFFDNYDRLRYEKEGHILEELDRIAFADREVLEIGLGQGADSEQIIRRGGRWSGLDLTEESVRRVRSRMAFRGFPVGAIEQGSILNAPFADDSFDIVFSHGVLHHVPDIRRAQSEIRRILRPDGELVVMLYAKWSLNYLFSIAIARRLALIACHLANWAPDEISRKHLDAAKEAGLLTYLEMKNFVHRNTDGPDNPYSKVYDTREIERDFPDFELIECRKRWNYAPPFPTTWLPGESLMGWHLWARLAPRRN